MTSAKSEEPRPDYLRVRITGTLTCKSDLHVGDGKVLSWQKRLDDLPKGREKPDLETDPDYHTVCWAEGVGPYIPASSIRGSLRSGLPVDDSLVQLLFGHVDAKKPEKSKGGKLRFRDAFLASPPSFGADGPPAYWSDRRKTGARHGIELDPLTGTAAHGRLYSHELVPAGSKFRVELEADDLTEDEFDGLLTLLNRWDGGLTSALGAKHGKGWGRVRWERQSVWKLTDERLREWLKDDSKPLLVEFNPERPQPGPPAEFEYTLIPDGPILVCEPGYVREKQKQRNEEKQQDHPPDHEYSRRPDNSKAVIPGSSLVGVARGRARRIVATIAHAHYGATLEQANICAEKLVEELFGDKTRRGALWIGDAEADTDPNVKIKVKKHQQFFNAIDRFTGGVKDGALYQANAKADGAYSGPIRLEAKRLEEQEKRRQESSEPGKPPTNDKDWWKGLLLLVLRDALEGELAVGWGKAKGYGAFKLELDGIKTWEELKARLEKEKNDARWGDPQIWIEALHACIEAICLESQQASQLEAGEETEAKP